ncbi:MAG: type II toxin-antitoxin system VapC family toxin [Candidatus Methanoperedens sp.]|nr:type II toxin-antitoxin system VapC family toxin [Candidatus Methanoperedens sp.]MCZ7360106.1 type II toxin-antitoxin system VapC family toxin [Candidatus Methanoperedens sp.]HLB71737.1 type II toxin-antitoxin system VapC family toxin [Candidatus Methanoperedens sp.]
MKYSLDTNVIISHFKGDKFSDDTYRFFTQVKHVGHEMYIADIVYAELYTGIYLSQDSATEEKRLQRFLAVNNIEVKYTSSKTAKRAGELYAQNLMKNNWSLKRILPDFIIGAHAEQYSDALITWNPSDYDINKEVMTPVEAMGEHGR